jgi:hypothetical protein
VPGALYCGGTGGWPSYQLSGVVYEKPKTSDTRASSSIPWHFAR